MFSLDIEGTSGTINHARLVERPELQRPRRRPASTSASRAPARAASSSPRPTASARSTKAAASRSASTIPCPPAATPVRRSTRCTVTSRCDRTAVRPRGRDRRASVYVTVTACVPVRRPSHPASVPVSGRPRDQSADGPTQTAAALRRRHVPRVETPPQPGVRDAVRAGLRLLPRGHAQRPDVYVSERSIVLVFDAHELRRTELRTRSRSTLGRQRRPRRGHADRHGEPLGDPAGLQPERPPALLRRRDRPQRRGRRSTTTTSPTSSSRSSTRTRSIRTTTASCSRAGATRDRPHPPGDRADRQVRDLARERADRRQTVVVDLKLSDLSPDPTRVCLTSTDPRFAQLAELPLVPSDPTTARRTRAIYTRHVHRRRTGSPGHRHDPRAQRLRAGGPAQHDDHAHDRPAADDRHAKYLAVPGGSGR